MDIQISSDPCRCKGHRLVLIFTVAIHPSATPKRIYFMQILNRPECAPPVTDRPSKSPESNAAEKSHVVKTTAGSNKLRRILIHTSKCRFFIDGFARLFRTLESSSKWAYLTHHSKLDIENVHIPSLSPSPSFPLPLFVPLTYTTVMR